ncbi:MAG: sulfite exporter TauE/SafE family protein [Clostridia bacterium]|nr:sulfite exporter TauE/SafE family protein [Clostridia bacterium]
MIVLIFLICLAASTIGGICGIGGGVVIKPLLDATGVMSVSTLSFLSGLTVLAMAVVNVWKNRKSKAIDAGRSLPLGIGAAVGGVIGKQIFQSLKAAVGSDQLVGLVQAIVLGILVLGTLLYVRNKSRIRARSIRNPWLCGAVGAVLGMLSSFLGIGGGPMNLAVLYYFFSMDTKQAAINSILVILLSQITSLGATLVSGAVPAFEWGVLAAMASAGILGGLLSAKLQKKMSAEKVDVLFQILLVIILLICVFNGWKAVGGI